MPVEWGIDSPEPDVLLHPVLRRRVLLNAYEELVGGDEHQNAVSTDAITMAIRGAARHVHRGIRALVFRLAPILNNALMSSARVRETCYRVSCQQ